MLVFFSLCALEQCLLTAIILLSTCVCTEENCICIETFTAENPDEVSLEKGVVVEVKQKNMDGWWTVRWAFLGQWIMLQCEVL